MVDYFLIRQIINIELPLENSGFQIFKVYFQ